MWDLLIRCNYLEWAPLQVVLAELTKGETSWVGLHETQG
jgi:hypothetical protein